MVKANIKGTEQNFLHICFLAIATGELYQEELFSISPVYTPEYFTSLRAKAVAAKGFPSEAARNSWHSLVRIEEEMANSEMLFNFQLLKGYIKSRWKGEEFKIMYAAAGSEYYRKAQGGNWDYCSELIDAAVDFMTANLTELLANNNMPASFPATFQASADAFTLLNTDFILKRRAAAKSTGTKNNSLIDLKDVINMLLYFGKKAAVKFGFNEDYFTYDYLLKEVRGNHRAGIGGMVKNSATMQPVEGVTVTVELLNRTTESAADGKYLLHLPSGNYTVKFMAPGFEELVLTGVEVEVGVVKRQNVSLTPAPLELAVAPAAPVHTVQPAYPAYSVSPAGELEMRQQGKSHSGNGVHAVGR